MRRLIALGLLGLLAWIPGRSWAWRIPDSTVAVIKQDQGDVCGNLAVSEDGAYLYLVCTAYAGSPRIVAYDIRDIKNIRKIGAFDALPNYWPGVFGAFGSGDGTLTILGGMAGTKITVLDVHDPANPKPYTDYEREQTRCASADGGHVLGDGRQIVLRFAEGCGLATRYIYRMIDLTNPSSPRETLVDDGTASGYLDWKNREKTTIPGLPAQASVLSQRGNLVLVEENDYGPIFRLYDLSVRGQPVRLSEFPYTDGYFYSIVSKDLIAAAMSDEHRSYFVGLIGKVETDFSSEELVRVFEEQKKIEDLCRSLEFSKKNTGTCLASYFPARVVMRNAQAQRLITEQPAGISAAARVEMLDYLATWLAHDFDEEKSSFKPAKTMTEKVIELDPGRARAWIALSNIDQTLARAAVSAEEKMSLWDQSLAAFRRYAALSGKATPQEIKEHDFDISRLYKKAKSICEYWAAAVRARREGDIVAPRGVKGAMTFRVECLGNRSCLETLLVDPMTESPPPDSDIPGIAWANEQDQSMSIVPFAGTSYILLHHGPEKVAIDPFKGPVCDYRKLQR